MKTQLHTNLKQTQQLNLSPQMQQSLKILQLSAIEIRELIDNSLLDNPFLDQESDCLALPTPPQSPLDDNPYTNYWAEQQPRNPNSERQFDINAQPTNLKTYLQEQFFITTTNEKLREAGLYLIDLIDEDGYLKLSKEHYHTKGFDNTLINKAVEIIKTLDPAGVGAKDLSECLSLQLQDLGVYDATYGLILSHLNLLTEKGPHALANRCGISTQTLRQRLDFIKTLNPKPGLSFSNNNITTYTTPDLIFKRYNGRWIAEINQAAYPRLMIDERSFFSIADKCKSIDDKLYVNKQISSANWLLKSLEQRATTLLKVAAAIIRHQEEFLNRGQSYLLPLKLKNIADEIDMHESTISRAVTGKYAVTPFGVMELKSFFSTALNEDQPALSNKTIQAQIKKLIEMEPQSAPLSDDQLVSTLKTYGINIARRTVTKYREALQIPSSYERKKLARALNF